MTDRTDVAFDNLVGELREDVDSAADRAAVRPDFADMVARAHALDPEVVGPQRVSEARSLADVVALPPPSERSSPGLELALSEVLNDVRVGVEQRVAQRKLAPIPAPGRPRRRAPWRWVAAAGMMAAAGIVAAVMSGTWTAVATDPEAPGQAANVDHSATGGDEVWTQSEPPPKARPVPKTRPTEVPEQAPAAEPEPPPLPPRPMKRPRATLDERLGTLDRAAQDAWRSGDLAAAEAKLRQVVRVAGRHRRHRAAAERAYAELFTIAHRGGGVSKRRALWTEYLRRFPRGRFADDARAGLCRSAAADARAACWQEYLVLLPNGSYRAEARRVIERESSP